MLCSCFCVEYFHSLLLLCSMFLHPLQLKAFLNIPPGREQLPVYYSIVKVLTKAYNENLAETFRI